MAMTLHEFTLGLLSDEQARTLFAADPTGVLQSAGLGDITAADVHEIVPLVLDMAPTHVVEALESSLGGAVPGLPSLPGGDAISTLQHLTSAVPALPVDGLARELPVDGLSSLPVQGLPTLPTLPGLDGLPSLPGLDGLPSLPGLDGLPSVPGLDSLPLAGIPAVPGLSSLPLDGITAAVPAVPGLSGLPVATDPTALIDEARGLTANPARSLDQVQQLASQVPVVAHGGIPAVPGVENLVGTVTTVASSVDVTKTLDTTSHTVAGVAGNVPVAGKVVTDVSGHVTSTVHAVDVHGVTNSVANTAAHLTDITKIAAGDPVHLVTDIAHDPITSVGNIANVVGAHSLDTVNSVHADQVLQHVGDVANTTVNDLNIGSDNHIGDIGNVNLGGVHVNDVTHNLDAGHLPGF